jgi:hypothetical protein
MITIEDSPSPPPVKDEAEHEYESSTPPPTTPKKARKTPSATSTPVSTSRKIPSSGGTPESQARTAKGRYMEMIIETGLKALNKKDVLAEVSPDDTFATRYTNT